MPPARSARATLARGPLSGRVRTAARAHICHPRSQPRTPHGPPPHMPSRTQSGWLCPRGGRACESVHIIQDPPRLEARVRAAIAPGIPGRAKAVPPPPRARCVLRAALGACCARFRHVSRAAGMPPAVLRRMCPCEPPSPFAQGFRPARVPLGTRRRQFGARR